MDEFNKIPVIQKIKFLVSGRGVEFKFEPTPHRSHGDKQGLHPLKTWGPLIHTKTDPGQFTQNLGPSTLKRDLGPSTLKRHNGGDAPQTPATSSVALKRPR